jgi:hypothetical protein
MILWCFRWNITACAYSCLAFFSTPPSLILRHLGSGLLIGLVADGQTKSRFMETDARAKLDLLQTERVGFDQGRRGAISCRNLQAQLFPR